MWAFSNLCTNLGASEITAAPWRSQGRDGLIQMKLKFRHAFIPVINLPESSKHCLYKWILKTCISCGLQQHFGSRGHHLWPVCSWNHPDYTNCTSGVGDKCKQSRRTSRRTSNPVPHCSGRLSQADRAQLSPISKQAGLALLQRSPSAIVQHRQDCPAWPSEGRGCFIYKMGGKNKVTELFFIWGEEEEKSSLIFNIQSAFRVICFQREKRKCGSWASTTTESFSHMHGDFWSKIKFLMNQNQNSTVYTKQPQETRAEPGSQSWSLHAGAQGWGQEGLWGTFPVGQATRPSIHRKGDQAWQLERLFLGDEDSHHEGMFLWDRRCWLKAAWLNEASNAEGSSTSHWVPSPGRKGKGRIASSIFSIQPFIAMASLTTQWGTVFQEENKIFVWPKMNFRAWNSPISHDKKCVFSVSPSNLFSHLCVDSQTKK